jgi:hypothetical protein
MHRLGKKSPILFLEIAVKSIPVSLERAAYMIFPSAEGFSSAVSSLNATLLSIRPIKRMKNKIQTIWL